MTNKSEQPPSSTGVEKLDAAEQAALAELRANLPDFIAGVEIKDSFGRREIEISFAKISHKIVPWETRAFYEFFNKTLAKHGMEKGRLQSSGNDREIYLLDKTTVNGKTNWRRWLYYPENMSPDIVTLLDVMAEDIGQQKGGDAAEKFCNFVEDAHKKGLITDEERLKILNQLYRAKHRLNKKIRPMGADFAFDR